MKKVYLLKEWDGQPSNSIVSVSNNVAFGLIDRGVARKVESKDYLVKPEFGVSRALKHNKVYTNNKKYEK